MDFNRYRANPVALLTPKKPHFFKVILTNTITEGKLGIPKEFARKYGSNLSNQVTLKVLPDSVWKIGLTRSDGVIWLQDGLKDFLDYYSIVHGRFLVFKYEKNPHFSVTIFDPTATEIDYPYDLIHEDEESEDSVSVENLDNTFQYRDRSRKSRYDKDGLGTSNVLRSIQSKILRMEPLKSDEKAVCLEMASGFVSDYPYFKVVLQPSFLGCGSRLNIPADFARAHMNKKESVILLSSDQKRWHVIFYGGTSFPAHPLARLHGGWLKFALNYNLEVGDVCAFELIRRNEKTLFRVTTFKFRENDNLNKLMFQETTGQLCGQGRTRELAEKFSSEHPFFKITYCPSHHNDVTAPWTFTEKLTKQTAEKDFTVVHLQFGEKSWPIKFCSYPEHKQGKFGTGWLVFASENSVETDDVCIFELINKDDAIVKVSIFKKFG